MFRRFAALAMLLALAACGTTQSATFSGKYDPPPASSRVVVMTPHVELHLLSAGGIPEPREDWSVSGRDNLAASIAAFVQSESHTPSALDPTTAMEGRIGQIIRLHDVVGGAIFNRHAFPTQKDRFEWTLGEGVRELSAAHNADYALFIGAYGTYASAGRVAVAVLGAIAGVGVGMGGQAVYASLVDLRTGNVIWFNLAVAAPNQDMRSAEGAESLVRSLLRGSPL
jgi:hypothetical protein